MKQLLALLLLALPALGEDLFVRPGGPGTSPTTWTGAWSSPANIAWGSGANQAGSGDTVYIAGGTYGPFSIDQSGVTIKRATTSDHGTETGWSSSYDAMVIINMPNDLNGIWLSTGVQNITIDGQTNYGFKIQNLGTSTNPTDDNSPQINAINIRNGGGCTFKHIEISGGWTQSSPSYAFRGPWDEAGQSALTIEDCSIHGLNSAFLGSFVQNFVFQRNKIYNIYSSGTPNWHGNGVYMDKIKYSYIINNEFYNIATGVQVVYYASQWGSASDTDYGYVVGNVFRDFEVYSGYTTGPIVFDSNPAENTAQYGSHWLIANNTYANILDKEFIQVYARSGTSTLPTLASGWGVMNNVSYNNTNISWSRASLNVDYNFFSGTGAAQASLETHGQNYGAGDPFVNYASANLRLAAATDAGTPIDSFDSRFLTDIDGGTRGADGTWDRGAYEVTGAAAAPTINSNNIVGGIGTNFSQTMTAGGAPTTWGATNLPANLTINNSGVVSGTVLSAVTNQTVGLFATNGTGFDVQTVLATFHPMSASLWRSSATVNFGFIATNGTAQQFVTVSNQTGTAGSTLTGIVHQFSAPFSMSGDTNYNLSGVTNKALTFVYSPTSVASNYDTATFTGDGNQTNVLVGYGVPIMIGTNFALVEGLLLGPMVASGSAVASTVSEIAFNSGNSVSVIWTAPVAGYYNIKCDVGGISDGANSFFVSVSGQTNFIWDIYELTDGLHYVHKRGSGTYESPEYVNYNITNTAGQQLIQIACREPNTYLTNLYIIFTATGGSDVTPPDTYTFDYPTNSGFTVTSSTNYTGIGGQADDSDGAILAVYWTNATTSTSGTATLDGTAWTNYPVSLNVGNNTIYMRAQNTNSLGAVTNITVYWAGTVAPVSGATLTGGTLKVGQ